MVFGRRNGAGVVRHGGRPPARCAHYRARAFAVCWTGGPALLDQRFLVAPATRRSSRREGSSRALPACSNWQLLPSSHAEDNGRAGAAGRSILSPWRSVTSPFHDTEVSPE